MSRHAQFHIAPVTSAADLSSTTQLFAAYASSLGIDLAFQGFQAEMDAMPGKYAPPAGALLLARDANARPIGCVGLRPVARPAACEMKRLYVSPQGRGLGIGLALIHAVIDSAARIGYREIVLDTLPSMASAAALYRRAGFMPIAPYYDSPVAGTVFMARALPGSAEQGDATTPNRTDLPGNRDQN